MASVHIGIRHQYDLIIAQLGNIKIIAIAFREPAAKGIDHGLDLGVSKNLVHGCLLHIEDFSPDRKDCLIFAVSGRLGGASGGISLYDKDLAFFRFPALTVGQLSIAVKGKSGFGQHVGLGLFLSAPYLGRLLGTGDHTL